MIIEEKPGKNGKILILSLLILCFSLIISCGLFSKTSEIDQYYITGFKEDREKLTELFNLLKAEAPGSEGEFVVIREIAANYARLGDFNRLISFLSTRTINNPADPYNAYYFLMIAYAHLQLGSEPIAALYFDLIVNNYPDLIISDESIHLACLQHLIYLNSSPKRMVWYYRELISRFPDKINLGASYFMLGQASERFGDWNGAIGAYVNYLPYSGPIIPGFPNAATYARQQVDYSRSAKDWTFESLPALRNAIEAALDAGSARMLMQHQARVNFFVRSWGQVEADDIGLTRFNLAPFMASNRVRYSPALDPSSTSTEAFLRTTGWTQALNTWYLYFRKIYFPQDPEIHGRWEWSGIYYGEKF